LVVSASFFFHSVLKSISWPVVSQSVSWSVGCMYNRSHEISRLVGRKVGKLSVRPLVLQTVDWLSVSLLVGLSVHRSVSYKTLLPPASEE
jgi:hypothetical protein